MKKPVRTRIAPSPTGDPHVGTAYIALFNLIFAKHHKGKFILRIEDTDRVRSQEQFEENIFKALRWCQIQWDEGPDIGGEFGPYRQSKRLDIYQKYIQILLKEKKAYKCFASPQELEEMREIAKKTGQRIGYDRRYRTLTDAEVQQREAQGQSYVIRLKVPLSGECVFEDAIKGRISTPWADVDDQVLIKSDGFPTYHFANVVDDYLMGITHVIRGDEWIASTPKHVLLYDAFGWEMPTFMHLPLLLGSDGRKLSKRRNPTSIFFYKDSGYLSDALINFLTLMGYSMPNEQEMYSLEEIISSFDAKRFGKSGAFFDIQKLQWLNQKYIIEKLTEKELLQQLKQWSFNDAFLEKLMPLVHTRIKTFGDFMELCHFFFINDVPINKEEICLKGLLPHHVVYLLQAMILLLEEKQNYSKETIEQTSHEIANIFAINYKKIMIPILFIAIMGKRFGPPLFHSCELLGKERVRARFMKAIEILGGISKKKMDLLGKALKQKDAKQLMDQS